MKVPRLSCLLAALVLTFPAPGPAAERIPAADFAKSAELSSAQLSPDGQYMAYVFMQDGWPQLSFLNLATNKAIRGARGEGHYLTTLNYEWISNERVLTYTYDGGLASVNRDGNDFQDFRSLQRRQIGEGIDGMVYTSRQDASRVLMNNFRADGWKRVPFPDVVAVNALTGTARVEEKNPGNVRAWAADWAGQVRFGLIREGLNTKIIHRDSAGKPWGELADLGEQAAKFTFAGLDATGRTMYVTRPDAKGYWTLYPFDLDQRRFGEPLLQNEPYDIVSGNSGLNYAGVALDAPIFSPERHTLLGINYVAESPRQRWFDPVLAAVQKKVDELNPGLVNFIVSMDRTEKQLLILSWSDQNPGFYSLLDLTKQKMRVIGQRMPWIKPAEMAPMIPIECKARDGLLLRGYVTLPVGRGQKNLPFVVLVHGGPWARDVWGFDPIVQFLASRGYAVLQINYRRSTGYGQNLMDRGKKEIGGAIQDDITDAVQWTIAKGIADPKRIAIMGASYGGYSTLFALARAPGLYRCGVALAAVTDWPALLKQRVEDNDDEKLAQTYWADLVGDWEDSKDRERLAAVSPVNLARDIKVPVYLVHGRRDKTVPFSQAKAMSSALSAAGNSPKTLFISDLGHSWPSNDYGTEFLKELEAFLAKNLGEGR